jgi:hypothetical protein
MAAKQGARRGLVVAGLACASLVLLGVCSTPPAVARTRCSYSGAPSNTLTVRSDGALAEIARRGQRIVVREYLEPPKRCSGGVPTVLNTDTIEVLLDPGGFADLLLRDGPFAPGATAELEGASEIEVEFVGEDIFAGVNGTGLADRFEWGPGPGREAGLNLNPGRAGDQDVDVTVEGNLATLNAVGRGGNDSILPAPDVVLPNASVFSTGGRGDDRLEAPRDGGGLLQGGPGDDVLIGGRRGDAIEGGGGKDRLSGAGGNDRIEPGSGRDVIRAGAGHDHIEARDSTRDVVRCGPGRDFVNADSQDRLRGCEARAQNRGPA